MSSRIPPRSSRRDRRSRTPPDGRVRLSIELDREDDERWIAKIPSLPRVAAYGSFRDDAIAAVEPLAIGVVTDRIAHRELPAWLA